MHLIRKLSSSLLIIVVLTLLFVYGKYAEEEPKLFKVNVNFEEGKGSVLILEDNNWSEISQPFSKEVEPETEIKLKVMPSEGYTIKEVLIEESKIVLDEDNSASVSIMQDSVIQVNFQEEEIEGAETKEVETEEEGSSKEMATRAGNIPIYTALMSKDTGWRIQPNDGVSAEHDEGVFRVNGELVWCVHSNKDFVSGYGSSRNFIGYCGADQALCTKIALALEGARQYMDAHNIHSVVADQGSPVLNHGPGPQLVDLSQYMVQQLIIWRYMSDSLQGMTYSNARISSSNMSYETQDNILNAAAAFVKANKDNYIGHGTVWWIDDVKQPVGRFSLEDITGHLTLTKVSSAPNMSNNNNCYSLEGAEFGVYTDAACTNKKGTLKTGANGKTSSLKLSRGTYYIREDVPPKGFAKQAEGSTPPVKTVTVSKGETTTVTFEDEPINDPFDILLEKRDSNITGSAQGDASLAGARFQLDYYDSLTVTKEQIKAGTVAPKDSYIFQTKKDVTGAGEVRYYINVADPECYIGSPTNSDLYRLNGIVTFPVGTLAIREITPPEGYHIEGSIIWDATENVESTDNLVIRRIETSGVSSPIHVYQQPINGNEVDKGSVRIIKRDIETGRSEPQGNATLEGAIFQIINESDNPVFYAGREVAVGSAVTQIMTEWVEADGAYIAEAADLPYGTYRIVEVQPPEGYLLEGVTEQTFQIRENGRTVQLFSDSQSIKDKVIRGGIQIKKRDFETGLDEAREETSLAGAVFEIESRCNHPIVVEGKEYNKFQVVKQIRTNEEGIAETSADLLPYGSYIIREIHPPTGFLLDGVLQREFRILDSGKIVDMFDVSDSITNLPIRGDLELLKLEGKEEGNEEDKMEGLPGVQFTITSKTTGEVVGVIETDEHGVATTKGMGDPRGALIYGTYIIEETKTPEGFLPVKPFEIKIREEGVTVRFIYLEDKLIMSPIQILKVDESTGKTIPVAGTTFRILDSDKNVITLVQRYPNTVEYTEFQTDDSGSFQLPEKLKYGTYFLEEVTSPEGYLKGELLEFKVEEDKDWGEATVVRYSDKNAMGKLKLEKTDESTGEAMKGVEFAIIATEDIITPEGTLRHSKGSTVETLITDDNGKAESKDLFIGKYLVKETKTLPGYVLDLKEYDFEVKYIDQDTPLDIITMQLTNKPTVVKLTKSDIDSTRLEGVKFELQNEDSNKELITNKDGEITLKYLTKGKYTLRETDTLSGYLLLKEPIHFFVNKTGRIVQTEEDGTWISQSPIELLDVDLVNDYTKVTFSKTDITGETEVEGATLQIKDSEGNIIEEWISTNEEHKVNKLPVGDYVLREELAPDGYVKASEVSFKVEETGDIQKVHMVDKQVEISKTDITGSKEVPGAELEVSDKETNEVIDQWVSAEEGSHFVTGLEVGKTYILTEKLTPEGYVTAESIEFTVDDDQKNQHIQMKDKQVLISKNVTFDNGKDEKTKNKDKKEVQFETGYFSGEGFLEGAKFNILDEEGNVVEEWVSSQEVHASSNLQDGKTYTLVEVEAPKGFVKLKPIEFTLDVDSEENLKLDLTNTRVLLSKQTIAGVELEGAKIQVKDSEGEIVDEWVSGKEPHAIENLTEGETYTFREESSPDGYLKVEEFDFVVDLKDMDLKITVTDDHTKVEISKVDVTTGKELPGAKLTLKDWNDKVVETWTSSDKPHMVERLVPGEYTLKEDLAPIGYNIANEIKFEVKPTGEVQHVKMEDEPKPKVKKLVQTGEAGLMMIISLLLIGCSLLFIRRVRKTK